VWNAHRSTDRMGYRQTGRRTDGQTEWDIDRLGVGQTDAHTAGVMIINSHRCCEDDSSKLQ
jgi:hypothetical protein